MKPRFLFSRSPVLCVLIWLALAPAVSAQPAGRMAMAAVDSLSLADLRGTVMTGAVVGIVSHGITDLRAYGRARHGGDDPLPVDAVFGAGGATELLNGLLAARLAAEGRVRLDAPIGGYVAGLPLALQPITLGQLLSHTGGLAFVPVVPGRGGADDLGHAARQLTFLDRFVEPGTIYSYSESGVGLAAWALERAGGRPYAELVRTLVLEPLGMRRSALGLEAALPLGLAVGHAPSDSPDAPLYVLAPQPDSVVALPRRGLFAAPADLARLAAALLDDGAVEGEVGLPPGVVAEVLRPRAALPGDSTGYAGLGVQVRRWEGRPEIRLSSAGNGYGMLVRLLTDDDLAVIVQTNSNGAMLPRTPEVVLRRSLGLPVPPRTPAAAPVLSPVEPARAARLAGSYTNGGERLTLTLEEGALRLASGGLRLDVRAATDGSLAAVIPDGRVALWVRPVEAGGRRFLIVGARALVREEG